MRPVFIPLKGEWFDAFRDGSKREEWRVYGPRWNDRSITVGRPVTLSRGYSGARLYGRVARVRRVARADAPVGALTLFPDAQEFCAIQVHVDGD